MTRTSVGDHLGGFEILGALGAGGMGEVYRARDSRLRREVAIKVLSSERSTDRARQRLELEARTVASLNHPNIVSVYELGMHEGRAFVVTELLQGETLRESLRERALPVRRAVEYAIQIASGLAAGHDRGVVHRDVKPENVFVTRDGVVKLLDFGLAAVDAPGSPLAPDATATVESAEIGRVAGTAAYMSPEQARGLRTDPRSDIFSLGSVLYEMVAGVAPFRRDNVADTLSAILNEEPRESAAIDAAPALSRIVQHCLEKRADDRFQHARDLVFALQSLSQSSGTTTPGIVRRRRAKGAVAGLLGVVLAAAGGYVAGTRGTRPAESVAAPTVRRLTESQGLEESPSISPDGRAVAFTAGVGGTRQVFVRLLAGGVPLAVTKDARDHQQPRWSPDGSSLVYFTPAGEGEEQGAIWSVPALGGSSRRLLSSISGADVSTSGRLACFQLVSGAIQLVSAALDGSGVRSVGPASAGYHRYPRWSPDGRWIAYQRGDGVRDDIFVVAASGGLPKRLTTERDVIAGLTWRPTSDGLVYASSRGNTVPYLPSLRLWEVGLDAGGSRLMTTADASYEQPDLHAPGHLVASRLRIRFDVWRIPFDGTAGDNVLRAQQITRQTGQVLTPTPAPDGGEIAFLADYGGHANLWVIGTGNGELRQLTFESDPAAAVGAPLWSPDGRAIAFVSSRGRTGLEFGVWLVNPDGSNLRNLAKSGLGVAWSPDGRWLYYSDTSAGALKKVAATGGEATVVRPEPTRNVIGLHEGTLYYMVERPLIDGRFQHEIRAASPEDGSSRLLALVDASRVASWQIVNPALSPDGQWLALPLTDGLVTNIWALSTQTGEWRRITDFGDRPTFIARRVSWAPDGKSLLAAVGEGDADIVMLDGVM